MFPIVEAIFQLNAMMFGDDDRHVSKENIPHLIDFFKYVNDEMVSSQIVEYFRDDENKSYQEAFKKKARDFLSGGANC
jgi:uncharacterized protein YehS (DUF1456 family)